MSTIVFVNGCGQKIESDYLAMVYRGRCVLKGYSPGWEARCPGPISFARATNPAAYNRGSSRSDRLCRSPMLPPCA